MALSESEEQAFVALLDEIIPPSADGRMPGAGEVGLAGRLVGELARDPATLEALRSGLATLDRVAGGERGASFAALGAEARRPVLEEVSKVEPSLVAGLLLPTWVAYYEHPRVLSALGLEPRPPHPGGYELAPFDESLLAPVRARPPLYRRV